MKKGIIILILVTVFVTSCGSDDREVLNQDRIKMSVNAAIPEYDYVSCSIYPNGNIVKTSNFQFETADGVEATAVMDTDRNSITTTVVTLRSGGEVRERIYDGIYPDRIIIENLQDVFSTLLHKISGNSGELLDKFDIMYDEGIPYVTGHINGYDYTIMVKLHTGRWIAVTGNKDAKTYEDLTDQAMKSLKTTDNMTASQDAEHTEDEEENSVK